MSMSNGQLPDHLIKRQPSAPPPPPTPTHTLHPAAQEAAVIYSTALVERDQIRAELVRVRQEAFDEIQRVRKLAAQEVDKLTNDLEVERRHCSELQFQLDQVIEKRDYFQRYAIEIHTHLDHIAASANAARDRALKVAEEDQAKLPPKPAPDAPPIGGLGFDEEIAAIAQKFKPREETEYDHK
jgi:hypothetical protein